MALAAAASTVCVKRASSACFDSGQRTLVTLMSRTTLPPQPELVRKLERLPGFRNVVIQEYVALDLDRVVDALDDLEPVQQFLEVVRTLAADDRS